VGVKDNALIGAAGVFHVATVFSQRGMIALPTIRNTAGYDLIVTSRNGSCDANVQVKTSDAHRGFWPICQKITSVKAGSHDFYVLLRRATSDPDAFEGFMLTGAEMKIGLEAYIAYYTDKGNAAALDKFALCLSLDLDKENADRWRERWRTWTLQCDEFKSSTAEGAG
jgi:hypothetical protein